MRDCDCDSRQRKGPDTTATKAAHEKGSSRASCSRATFLPVHRQEMHMTLPVPEHEPHDSPCRSAAFLPRLIPGQPLPSAGRLGPASTRPSGQPPSCAPCPGRHPSWRPPAGAAPSWQRHLSACSDDTPAAHLRQAVAWTSWLWKLPQARTACCQGPRRCRTPRTRSPTHAAQGQQAAPVSLGGGRQPAGLCCAQQCQTACTSQPAKLARRLRLLAQRDS